MRFILILKCSSEMTLSLSLVEYYKMYSLALTSDESASLILITFITTFIAFVSILRLGLFYTLFVLLERV
jgi:hypothetical protein